MEKDQLISVKEFCTHQEIELSLIFSLGESGLINIFQVDEDIFISENEFSKLEMLLRLHSEMDINIEGIETITYLLEQISALQQKIELLHTRLSLYESI